MKKLGLIVLGVVLFLAVFWMGFLLHFPGAALSRMIESKIETVPGLKANLSPARLTLTGLRADTLGLVLLRPEGPVSLITLKDLSVSLTWRLWNGLPLEGRLENGGSLEVFSPWDAQPLSLRVTGIALEKIPALAIFKPLQISGRVTLSGNLDMRDVRGGRRAHLPKGAVTAKGEQLAVQQLEVMGNPLPATRLDSLDLEVTTGDRIQVNQLAFKGDMQGTVTGYFRPRLSNLMQSSMQLQVSVSFRPDWLSKLGPLEVLAEGFLKDGRLQATVQGTLDNPRLRPARGNT